MSEVLPPPDTDSGRALRTRLETEIVIWLTTTSADGTPQPNPVWFLWEGRTILTYNRADAARVGHVRKRSRVSLNFDGDGRGGRITVIAGDAEIVEAPPADQNPEYVRKYADQITRIGHDVPGFGRAYPVAIRIVPTRVRGF